jgi:hypothetical protein
VERVERAHGRGEWLEGSREHRRRQLEHPDTMDERARRLALSLVQNSYSSSRLLISDSSQSDAGGTRSSARRCARATDVST